MKFPKAMMTTQELIKFGFRRGQLLRIAQDPRQKCCWKITPAANNSKLQWDTEELEKYLKRGNYKL